MARYQVPPDPRDPENDLSSKRTRHQRQGSGEPIPWLWLGMGVVVTIVGIVLAFAIANSFLSRPPLDVLPLEPTIIVLTAPPSPTPTITPPVSTPTPIPTLTPIPTPEAPFIPEEVTIGYYVVVANTGLSGVTVRSGPSTDNVQLGVASEGAVMLVIGGPEQGSDRLWWQVQLEDGTEGWVAAEFVEPSAAP